MPTRLPGLRHLALDLDGTLYRGGTLFPWTPGFLAALARRGMGRSFVTNNSSRSGDGHARWLRELGIDAAPEEVFTSGQAAIGLLRRDYPGVRHLYVLGTPDLCDELAAAGFEPGDDRPELVLVGFDRSLTFASLCRAAHWLERGLPFVATHLDRVCPTDAETVLVDCGALCACLESATGRAPDAVAGKPEPALLEGVCKRHGLAKGELAVVGDRLYTDIRMARTAGVFSVLVLSGETRRGDLDGSPDRPDLVVEHVGELAELLAELPDGGA